MLSRAKFFLDRMDKRGTACLLEIVDVFGQHVEKYKVVSPHIKRVFRAFFIIQINCCLEASIIFFKKQVSSYDL